MSGKRKFSDRINDTVTWMPDRSDLTLMKPQPQMPDFQSNKIAIGKTTALNFNDMCDHVVDMILCELKLVDLVNISDTSLRLKGIARSVFLRKHSHKLLSMDVYHYLSNVCEKLRGRLEADDLPFRKFQSVVRISDAKVWFKLMRNFGGSIKHVHIYSCECGYRTRIPYAMHTLTKYVFDFCRDSLETLYVIGYQFMALTKPLTKVRDFLYITKCFEISELLLLIPNVCNMTLACVPGTVANIYAKLERVILHLNSDDEAQTFISFTHLNRQIETLYVSIGLKCNPEHNDQILSAISDNLTQLKTLKLIVENMSRRDPVSRFRFKTVESFTVVDEHQRIIFDFDDLRKVTFVRSAKPLYCLDFAQRNKKLKILKFYNMHEAFWNVGVIQNLLSELPELEQIIVEMKENLNSIFKKLIGVEWEQIEKSGKVKGQWEPGLQRFRKIRNDKKT